MRKKLLFLAITILGGFLVMTGCQENKNSREWIEDKVSEVSRVYPTENLFDLFEEFPEGFEIKSVKQYTLEGSSYSNRLFLTGDSSTKQISGSFKKVLKESKPYKETILVESDVTYTENGLEFSNPDVSEETLVYKGFLFQKWTLDKAVLSQLPLKRKAYDWETGDASIEYTVKDETVNDYFGREENSEIDLRIGARNATLIGDYYSFSFMFRGEDVHYAESVVGYDKENVDD